MDGYQVRLADLSSPATLVTRFTCSADQLGRRFLTDLPRILDVALGGGCRLAGPPFALYLGGTLEELQMEIGLIIAQPHEGAADVRGSRLPGGQTASTLHVGPYETLGQAHAALRGWALAHGYVPAGLIYELYVSDPSDGDDPNGWRTEVFLPLLGGTSGVA
ncbi:MAG: GyrI-like domain-containing protein [Hyphomicrobiaceae bacterium]|nr:GyrI-like domain-containing protein [Hyphomicrobiaceae bacterium]